jgi:hypothetical protein
MQPNADHSLRKNRPDKAAFLHQGMDLRSLLRECTTRLRHHETYSPSSSWPWYIPNPYSSPIKLNILETIWASGHELYDHFSPAYQRFFETLTATHKTHSQTAISHPLVRTNPLTNRKSIFTVGPYVQKIHELAERESSHLRADIQRVVGENHGMQVRYKWSKDDVGMFALCALSGRVLWAWS